MNKKIRVSLIIMLFFIPYCYAFSFGGFLAAAIASAILSTIASLLTRPSIPSPPQPAGYSGPEGKQVWNPETNQYEWVPSEEYLEKQRQQKLREQKIQEIEASLASPEPERVKQLEEFQQSYKQRLLTPLTEQYQKARQNLIEDFTRRGLGNSRAMVDALKELESEWMKTQEDVEARAIAARESLEQQDFQRKREIINSLRQGISLNQAEQELAKSEAAKQSQMASTLNQANWQALVGQKMSEWSNLTGAIKSGMGTASNLALLYGLYSGQKPQLFSLTGAQYGIANLPETSLAQKYGVRLVY